MMQSTGSQVERDGIWLWARKAAMMLTSFDRVCAGSEDPIFDDWREGVAEL